MLLLLLLLLFLFCFLFFVFFLNFVVVVVVVVVFLSDDNFRKSIMICQIIDSVDNHFGEYLWHFLVVRLYSWISV